ncbi:degenerate transposase [Streptococcus pneumoniae]|nr:degenerate transposase [Streptococcus pneumoniae]
MEQLHFITKLLDIKDPNIKILDIINMDTHKEIIAKLDYDAPSCPDCGSLMKKYDFQKHRSEHQKRKDEICPFSSLAFLQPTTVDKEPFFASFFWKVVW